MTERPLIRTAQQVRLLLAGATVVRVPVVLRRFRAARGCSFGSDWKSVGALKLVGDEWRTMLGKWPGVSIGTLRCPLGVAGDRLVVKEAWRVQRSSERLRQAAIEWKADGAAAVLSVSAGLPVPAGDGYATADRDAAWRPSTTMPRWAARLVLEVVEVRAQRAREITAADAIAEGATGRPGCYGYQQREPGWSMDWSRVGAPSRYAGGKAALTESDIALGSPVSALGNEWNRQYARKGYGWDANPWTFAVRVRRAEASS